VNTPEVNPPVEITPPTTTTKTTPKTKPKSLSPLSGDTGTDGITSKPLILAGAPINSKFGLKKLNQLYDNLDPHLARILTQSGILPSRPTKEDTKPVEKSKDRSEEPTQAEIDAQNAELKKNVFSKAEPEHAADGGTMLSDAFKAFQANDKMPLSRPQYLSAAPSSNVPGYETKSRLSPLTHLKQGIRRDSSSTPLLAQGGLPNKYKKALPKGHNPEFITGLTGYYANGRGTGQSDDIPAMLHSGDYVMDADTVASFGDGSSKAGAQVMDKLHRTIPHKMSIGGDPVPAKIADGEYVFPESFVSALGGGDNKLGSKLLDTMREELRSHKRSAPDTKIPPKAKSPLEYLKMAKG
jgi:hypothetical protein